MVVSRGASDESLPMARKPMSILHQNSEDDSDEPSTQHELAYSIVWSPLPPITWILPFIGHTGIANSQGTASDFQGPYYVGTDGRMAFGPATRTLRISPPPENWDEAIESANRVYNNRMHNLFCDNCHSHVACALNEAQCSHFGISRWNMVNLCWMIFTRGKFRSIRAVLVQFGPFLVVAVVTIWLTWGRSR